MVLCCSLAQVVQAKVQQIYADRALPTPGEFAMGQEPFVNDGLKLLAGCCRYPGLVSLDAETAKLDVDDCCHKTDKQAHLKVSRIFGRGKLEHYQLLAPASPSEKWQELLTYLEKHQLEIINYERRTQIDWGGRVERQLIKSLGSVKA